MLVIFWCCSGLGGLHYLARQPVALERAATLWWAVAPLTTTNGDVVPVTPLGWPDAAPMICGSRIGL